MKKNYAIVAAMALAGSGSALAAENLDPSPGATYYAACDGATAAKYNQFGAPGTPYTTANSFVKTGFSVQCSSNTYVAYQNISGTQFLVGAGSAKGNQSFRGSSNGGAVITHTVCTSTNQACSAGDATTATNAASSM
jgi:hypothetical protein